MDGMKVFLDAAPALREACRVGGRSVVGLEWVSEPAAAEGVVADRLGLLEPGKRALYLGPLAELAEVSDAGESETGWTVGHRWRFEPAVRAVHESLQAGQLGRPGLLRIHCWMAADVPASPRAGKFSEPDCREDLVAQLDLALWLFGRLPKTVYAAGQGEASVLLVHLGFSDGGMAIIDFAWRLPPGGGYYSLHLIGDNGAAYADDHRNVSLLYGGEEPQALRVDNGYSTISAMLGAFAGAPGCGATVSLEETRSALRLVAIAIQSWKSACPVSMGESAPAKEGQ